MTSKQHTGTNCLENYFGPDSATYSVMEMMHKGNRRFNSGLIDRAAEEVRTKIKALDASTYPFSQDLSRHLYPEEDRRIVMLVEGTFYGEDSIETIVPIDLTKNSYQLFKGRDQRDTIDDRVTSQQTRAFINTNRDYLSQEGYTAFEVDKSRFFYFRESDLSDFLSKSGEIDMVRLVPLIVPTKGHVVLDEVEEPSLEDYMDSAPTHVSYRLKKSLMTKLLGRFVSGSPNVRLVADWVAHRPVVESMEDVNGLELFLKGPDYHRKDVPENEKRPAVVGKSRVKYLYTNDYYDNPKGNEFKAKNVIARVTAKGFEPSIREIQIVDKEQYFINELQKGKESHEAHERRRGRVPRRMRDTHERYSEILEQIFGRDTEIINI